MSGAPESGFRRVVYSAKWQFPALGNGLKLTNQGTEKYEHISSPGEKEASNLWRKVLSPVSQWEASLQPERPMGSNKKCLKLERQADLLT